jgi:transcriptional regulator with XRE-family HTH domain
MNEITNTNFKRGVLNQDATKEVASFIEDLVNRSKLSQKEIAEMCGFKTPNVITMIKQGATRLPKDKIAILAKALDVDRGEFFEFVMSRYDPELLDVISQIFGEPITQAERKVIKLLREIIPEGHLVSNTPYFLEKIKGAIDK